MSFLNQSPKPNSWLDYLGAIILFAVFLTGIVIFWRTVILPQKDNLEVRREVEKILVEKEIILRAPKCERSFEEYKKLVELGQTISILENKPSYAVGDDLRPYEKTISRSGELACGYIFIVARVGTKPLDDKFDSLYINPQGLGGHLIRPRGISLEKNDNKTEVLFPLSEMSYLPNVPYNPEAQDFETADWVKLFNAAQKIDFLIGLSTVNRSGMIDEVRIAYRCWNPETGKETNDCQLSVQN